MADFDPGPGVFNLTSAGFGDIFISKLDASGNFVWAKRMGGASYDDGYSIVVDPLGNVLMFQKLSQASFVEKVLYSPVPTAKKDQ